MTQKELSYLEDAINHEESIIKICNNAINSLEDENLINFMDNEANIHTRLLDNLMELLEEKSNGW